jgi:thioesterase domain-containing protein
LRNSFFLWVNARAERSYQHHPYEGEMIVFRDQANYPDPSQGWSRFVHNIEVCEIPVTSDDHRALLKEPAVALLADKLRELSNAKTGVAVGMQKAA